MTDIIESVPGTNYLVDVNRKVEVQHIGATGSSDIVLILQPTEFGGDPLTWSRWKKYYQLFIVALSACAFSYGENTLGAAWTTVSEDTGVSLTNMNGGSALNYLLLGFVYIFWIPAAMKIGRRPVFIVTTILCLCAGVWLGKFQGTGQWFGSMILNGLGTSAYQAVIQLSVFDMFFAHERGRMLTLALSQEDQSQIILAGDRVKTLFPRFLFSNLGIAGNSKTEPELGSNKKSVYSSTVADESKTNDFPKRTAIQRLELWSYIVGDHTTYWQYFRRPFFLLSFPDVIIAGFIFAFGCTAGIVSFNTISEILTSPPYNWSTTSTGLVFLAALVGNIFGWATGALSDQIVIRLARRNDGVKEPEMRLWTLGFSIVYALLGYFLYGWGAQSGAHWMTIAFGVGCMIAHQVSACSIATAYAMECFPGISGEIVVILAMCSSLINFAFSYSVQPFINAVGYGWTFTFFGLAVFASMVAAVPMIVYGKRWRVQCAPKYYRFISEGRVE
ncbi:hypothetical protein BGZ60DRAFT_526872 [Tricladium varicosporioides]|nr:hypothetical protein BGZ60DRAFT_526872 [Hymenoscyphus varicosporioides]